MKNEKYKLYLNILKSYFLNYKKSIDWTYVLILYFIMICLILSEGCTYMRFFTTTGVFFILTLVTLVSFFIFSVFSKKISIALIRYQYKKHNYNEIERKYLNLEMSIRYHSFNNDGKDDNFIERDVYSNTLTSDFHFKVEYKKAYPVPDFNLFKLWIDYILHLITFKRG